MNENLRIQKHNSAYLWASVGFVEDRQSSGDHQSKPLKYKTHNILKIKKLSM